MNKYEKYLKETNIQTKSKYRIVHRQLTAVLIEYLYGNSADRYRIPNLDPEGRYWWVSNEGSTMRSLSDPEFGSDITIEDCYE